MVCSPNPEEGGVAIELGIPKVGGGTAAPASRTEMTLPEKPAQLEDLPDLLDERLRRADDRPLRGRYRCFVVLRPEERRMTDALPGFTGIAGRDGASDFVACIR